MIVNSRHGVLYPIIVLALMSLPLAAGTAFAKAERIDRYDRAVEELLARMTLEEKIGQLNFVSHEIDSDQQLQNIRAGRIGNVLNVVHPERVAQYREAASKSRLAIPLIFGLDAISSFRIAFPPPIAWAATWRPELAEEAAAAVGREAAGNGINLTFAPMVDVSRDPRWGRVIEGAGEDAMLGSAFAAARVRGYRSAGLETAVKHFVGYGAPEAGRDYNGAQISTSELYDRHLPPFKAAIDAGARMVMASFNTINGVPVTVDRRLLTSLLRDEWGFDGVVTSDFFAIPELLNHGVAADLTSAGSKALLAGIDLDMAGSAYDRHLADEVAAGHVPMSALDDAVRRVLKLKYRMGLFAGDATSSHDATPSRPALAGSGRIEEATTRTLARQVARESLVLVKNDDAILPLTSNDKKIALIGAWAESDYDTSWYGPAGLTKPATETFLQAMRKRLAAGQTLDYAKGFTDACGQTLASKEDAVRAAEAADVVVMVVAEDCIVSGEATSRADLGLSGVQQELLEAVVTTSKPVALVVATGRPLTLTWADRNVAAMIIAWHPGTEGRIALAEALFGEYSPSGKLPMTFPRSVGQIPISYNVLPTSRPPIATNRYTSRYLDEEITPLYPFGWGLSYATFAYSDLVLSSGEMPANGSVDLEVTVRNTGNRLAEEVVQIYTRQPVASRSRPVRELKGFQKVALKPGQEKAVGFTLEAADLAYHDDDGRAVVEPGTIQVFAGGSSDTDLMATFEIVPAGRLIQPASQRSR